jgi:AraC-like DNA-binding protein
MLLQTANRFVYRGSPKTVSPGAVVVAEPGEVHVAEQICGPYDVDVLWFDASSISRLTGNAQLLPPGFSFKDPMSASPFLARAFRALATALRNREATRLLLEEQLLTVLEAVRLAYSGRVAPQWNASRDVAGVLRARGLICDRHAEVIGLAELADVSGLPMTRFLRAFKAIMGFPPHAYQVRLRVDRARRLIASGAGLSEAAVEAGFSDQSHLHRHFVRILGVTPGAYARFQGRR